MITHITDRERQKDALIRTLESARDEMAKRIEALTAPLPAERVEPLTFNEPRKPEFQKWPFAESPGRLSERLSSALNYFGGDMLAAVRNVFIEQGAPPATAPLTDADIYRIWAMCPDRLHDSGWIETFARAIERAHGIAAAPQDKP